MFNNLSTIYSNRIEEENVRAIDYCKTMAEFMCLFRHVLGLGPALSRLAGHAGPGQHGTGKGGGEGGPPGERQKQYEWRIKAGPHVRG
jgi:hypothetical protein